MLPVRYVVSAAQNHMATTFEFEVSVGMNDVPRAERELERALREVARLESILSEYRKGSDVARLNAAKAGEWIRVDRAVVELLEMSESVFRLSEGAFDPTFRSAGGTGLPDRFEWDFQGARARKRIDGARIGFGAIGKGYALDCVRLLLEQQGFQDYRLNSGGSSLILSGSEDGEHPWSLGWAWKKDSAGEYFGKHLQVQTGRTLCLGISGSLEQGEHIHFAGAASGDALVGAPTPAARAGTDHLLSTLVASASAAEADALSTAIYAGRFNHPFLDTVATAVVDAEGNLRANPKFFQWFSLETRKAG